MSNREKKPNCIDDILWEVIGSEFLKELVMIHAIKGRFSINENYVGFALRFPFFKPVSYTHLTLPTN